MKFCPFSLFLLMKLKLSLVRQLRFLGVIIRKNNFLLLFLLFCQHRTFSISPHTPQQNDIAERKNRHLVETARTLLLLHANVPIRHWGDAVLTACFLINRMPSSSIKNKIPHSILFPKETLFHVDPRIFGCTCFVHNLSPGLDSFSLL